jgi:CheY-like chemotaxis protein
MEDDKRILVVTSSDSKQKDCVDQLSQMGFENINSATNGVEALKLLRDSPIDMVLSDWDLPDTDGLELLKTIKKSPSLQGTPFIFLTAHTDEEKNRQAMTYGAVDNFADPSSSTNLKENIEIILNRGIRNILIVEDSDIQREICIAQLQQIGFEKITGATNGKEALEYLENNSVDFILSDWNMPELNGLELLKKVKGNTALKDIPFLILTINNDEDKNQEALNLGAIDYIVKPLMPDDLHFKIRKILY